MVEEVVRRFHEHLGIHPQISRTSRNSSADFADFRRFYFLHEAGSSLVTGLSDAKQRFHLRTHPQISQIFADFYFLQRPARHSSPVTSHQSPVTSHQSPVTSHQSPVTSHQSLVTGCCRLS